MRIGIVSMNSSEEVRLAMQVAALARMSGHEAIRIDYWTTDFLPIDHYKDPVVPQISIVDGGFPNMPRISEAEMQAILTRPPDIVDASVHELARLASIGEVLPAFLGHDYFSSLRGFSVKVDNVLRALKVDAIILMHGAEPLSRLIENRCLALGIPLLYLESSFVKGRISLDVGGPHFFRESSRIDREWQKLAATPLSNHQLGKVEKWKSDRKRSLDSKYTQKTELSELYRLEKFLSEGSGPVLFVPEQVPFDANVLINLGENSSFSDALTTLSCACEGHLRIVLKQHPYAPDSSVRISGNHVFRTRHVSIFDLFRRTSAVATQSSNVGFDAIVAGVPVITWGRPYYAQIGLTTSVHSVNSVHLALSGAQTPDQDLIDRFIYFIVFEHLIEMDDAESFNRRLDESRTSSLMPCPRRAQHYPMMVQSAIAAIRSQKKKPTTVHGEKKIFEIAASKFDSNVAGLGHDPEYSGHFVWGGMATLEPGDWTATFKMSSKRAGLFARRYGYAAVEAVSSDGVILARSIVDKTEAAQLGNWTVKISWAQSIRSKIEFRIWSEGSPFIGVTFFRGLSLERTNIA